MSELARFNSKENITPSARFTGASSFGALESFLNGVSKKVRDFADEQAVQVSAEQGAIAGEDPSFSPGASFNKASRAFNNAALKTNKFINGALVNNKIDQFAQDARQNLSDTSVEDFNQRVKGYAEGVLSSTPSANHGYIKQLILYQANRHSLDLNHKLFDKNQTVLSNQLDETYHSFSNQMGNAAQDGNDDAASSFHGMISNLLESGLEQGLLNKSQFISYSEHNDQELHTNTALGQFNQSFERGEGEKFIQNFQKSKEANRLFSPIEKENLIKKMHGILKQHALETGVISGTFNETLNNMVIETKLGATIDPRRVEIAKLAFPKKALKIDTSLELATVYHTDVQNSKSFGIGDLQRRVSELSQPMALSEINEAKKTGVTASQLQAHRQSLLQAYNNQLRLLVSDPVAATDENPIIQQEREKINEGLEADVNQKRLQVYQQFGLPQDKWRLLSKAQASAIIQDVRSVPFDQGVDKIDQLKESFGENWRYAYPAIYKDIGMNYQLGSAIKTIPESRVDFGDYSSAMATPESTINTLLKSQGIKSQDVKEAVGSLMGDYFSTFTNYPANNLKQLASIQNSVNRLALFYRLSANHGQSDASAATEAYNVVIGNLYSEINSGSYRVPHNVDANQVRRAIDISNFQIDQARKNKELPGFREGEENLRDIDFNDLIKTGKWINDPTHENTLKFVDALGVTVRKKDGKPFSLNMNKLEFPDEIIDEFFSSQSKEAALIASVIKFR